MHALQISRFVNRTFLILPEHLRRCPETALTTDHSSYDFLSESGLLTIAS